MKKRKFYTAAKIVMNIITRVQYRVRTAGAEHIPCEGAFILCANHLHGIDPVVLAISIKRQLNFMAKKELFKNKFIGGVLGLCGAFPVDRGTADMRSYKKAIWVLEEGGGLLIFSQGHRMASFENVKGGAAMFALRTGAPIVPAGLKGSYKLFSTITVRFGEPIDMAPYAGRKIKTELVNELTEKAIAVVKTLAQ
jgi:1-acyl-sn-glycerol-3-phosphate acyltransferase